MTKAKGLPLTSSHKGNIVNLSFFDHEKNIVRGKEQKIPSRPKN